MAEFCLAIGPASLLRVGCIWVLELGRFQLMVIGRVWGWRILP